MRNHLLALLALALAAPCALAQTLPSWSTIITGNGSDAVKAMALAPDGSVWVAGFSTSIFEAQGFNTPYQKSPKGAGDIFLAQYRAEPDGSVNLLWFTWLGGTGKDEVRAMALGPNGRVYLTGTTDSADFPIAGTSMQTANGGATDAFVAIFDPTIDGEFSLAFSSYWGGEGIEIPNAIAVEPGGAMVVAGQTPSDKLPNVDGNVQANSRGGTDAFLLRVDPSESAPLRYATYFGGKSTDIATGVGIAPDGRIWFTGYTASDDFPVTSGAYNEFYGTPFEGFLVALDLRRSGLDALVYGTYFGGAGIDSPTALSIDSTGRIWVAGYTTSGDFPVTANAAQAGYAGNTDGFVLRFDPSRPAADSITYGTFFGGGGAEVVSSFANLGGGRFAIAGYTMFGGLPSTSNAIQPTPKSAFAEALLAVIAIDPGAGPAVRYATYWGGAYTDAATAVAGNESGALYFGGLTTSNDFVTTDGTTRALNSAVSSAFITRLSQ
jgi:hypothetical protein